MSILLLMLFSSAAAQQPSGLAQQQKSPFCAQSNCAPTRKTFKRICDLIVKKKRTYPAIFIGGYYMRDLIAGYEIFGDRRYLDTAIAYGDYLLGKQMSNGFWGTGYGAVYLADTGSALGLFIALYKYADHARQRKYFEAIKHYTATIQSSGMIHPNGAFGVGWNGHKNGKLLDPNYEPYTLSSALTGATIFTWMYHKTKQNKYRKVAYRALRWIFSTMRGDGNVPHIGPIDGGDQVIGGTQKTDFNLWRQQTYGTAAYVGEGVISFDLHSDKPAWKAWLEKAVRPNIEFLLRTQLKDGTWSKRGRKSWDRTRSPGIINYLIWYYENVQHDPRIAKAVQRFDAYVTAPKNGKRYGLLIDGAQYSGKHHPFNVATSLTGRALAGILSPGVDAKW